MDRVPASYLDEALEVGRCPFLRSRIVNAEFGTHVSWPKWSAGMGSRSQVSASSFQWAAGATRAVDGARVLMSTGAEDIH